MASVIQALSRLTLGRPRNYVRMTAWRILDSIVGSLPAGIMIAAVWFLLEPIADPGASLDVGALWACLGSLLLQSVLAYLTSRKVYILTCSGTADIVLEDRLSMGEKFRRLPMGFYAGHDAGDLTSVLLRDYNAVEEYGSEMLAQIGSIFARLLLSCTILIFFDWRMAIALMAVVPLALPFLYQGFHTMKNISDDMTQAVQECDSKSIEYVGGILTLRAFGLAGVRFDALKRSFDNLRKVSIRKEAASRPVGIFGRLILSCGLGVVMLVGCSLLVAGTLQPFFFLVFLLIALNLYEPIISMFYFLSDFANANKASQRIEAIMEERELPEPAAGERKIHFSGYDLAFDGVYFGYGNDEVLHDVSLRVPQKGLTALVGHSGSGKSTVVRLMARFWDPVAGEIRLGETPFDHLGSESVLAHVSVVFQDVYLFQDTIANNIGMGKAGATDDEIIDAAKRAACHDFIMKLPHRYQTVVGEGGSTLSGGQKQRVSIARALLKDAPVVLLDEATASLDPQNEVLVQQAIAELVKDKTVVVIAHRLRSISRADQIVVMESGAVSCVGTHEELLEESVLYAGMWRAQQKAGAWRIASS